jgi:hypothetical protein
MAIKVSYTPYGAVGGLAEYAGQAQQAIREQQFAKQRESQAAAQERMQAERIGASREEWQRKLTSQQEQFALNQELQQEQIFRQQQASEFATMRNAQVAEARSAAQQGQFEQNLALQEQRFKADVAAKEQTFELQKAQEERLMQSAQANAQAQELRSAFNFKKLETATGTMAENLKRWKQVKQYMSPEEQVAGDIAISQGKVPRIRAETDALIRERREFDLKKKREELAAGLTDRGRAVAQNEFENTFGTEATWWSGLWGGMKKTALKGKYEDYLIRTGYANRNPAEKKELDQLFDINVKTYEDAGWFDYYSEWDPKDKNIKDMRAKATKQIIPGSLGKISDPEALKLFNQVRTAHPEYTKIQAQDKARSIAISKGYTS